MVKSKEGRKAHRSEEFDEADELIEFVGRNDNRPFAGLGGGKLVFDESALGAATGADCFAFAETREGVDKSKVEFRFLPDCVGEAPGVEREKKFVKLGRGDSAPC